MRAFPKTALGLFVITVLLLGVLASPAPAEAATKKSFRIAWSIYVGWMPWAYAAETGIMKKWADKYGIEIELVQVKNYIESINQYTSGAFDGCAMTNMDALTIPAAGGVDSSAVIIGDFSNGNDGIVLKSGPSLAHLKGRCIGLVEFSVATGADLPTTMNRVRKFSFAHGLLGNGAPSADAVGIQVSDGQVLGDPDNVKLRFDTEYMALAADGKP